MKKRSIILKIIFTLLSCSILVLALYFYSNTLEQKLNTETKTTLEEVSAQSTMLVQKELKGELDLLARLSDHIGSNQTFHIPTIIEQLSDILSHYSFKRMGIISADGVTYTTDHVQMNLSDRSYFQDGLNGKSCISDRLTDRSDFDHIIVFSTPIYIKNNIEGVLFATYSVDKLKQILSVSTFNGNGYSYIVQKNGDAVVDSNHKTSFQDLNNIYTALVISNKSNQSTVEQLKNDLAKKQSGYVRFVNDVPKYMYYTPLDIEDWYLLNIVPTNIIDSTIDLVMNLTYSLCVLLTLIFLFLIWYIIRIEKQKNKELTRILYVDEVTGGFSYTRFCIEAKKILVQTDQPAAFITLDIDKFKLINDLYGYEEGNRTLCYMNDALERFLHNNELCARRVADRFVLLLFFQEREEITSRLEAFNELIQNILLGNNEHYVLKLTMGIYVIQDYFDDIQMIQNCAVIAHSTIKNKHDQLYAFYDEVYREKMHQNKQLENQMEHAYIHHNFVAYYQPKYNTANTDLVGAEALIRWKKEDGSLIPPGIFIPLAEDTGFICKLDKYIFKMVCYQQKKWIDQGIDPVPISVNVSRQLLYNPEFVAEYKQIIEELKLPIKYVQLEITESAVFDDMDAFLSIIENMHQLGFIVLMDDFGTGYSSLTMLKSIPIDILKLDKSFVNDYNDPRGEIIITSVIQLAQSLKIRITAEGVETKEQFEFLKALECDDIQGYYFAKPMPNYEFEKLL